MTKFHNDWVKIVDFLKKSIFLFESTVAWATLYKVKVSIDRLSKHGKEAALGVRQISMLVYMDGVKKPKSCI